jgi:hypothetical protein
VITSILVYSCVLASLLIVWFRTDAYLEYARVFRLNKISFYKDFDAKHIEDAHLTYFGYLRQYHNSFFTRLVTCPICVSVWIATILSVVLSLWWIYPTVLVFGLIFFGITDRLLG